MGNAEFGMYQFRIADFGLRIESNGEWEMYQFRIADFGLRIESNGEWGMYQFRIADADCGSPSNEAQTCFQDPLAAVVFLNRDERSMTNHSIRNPKSAIRNLYIPHFAFDIRHSAVPSQKSP
jgi:hypothetical protein